MLLYAAIFIIAVIIVLILKSKFLPGNIMALVPIAVALIIGTSFEDTMLNVHKGISDVLVIAALFILATIFFGVMSDAGLFDPIIKFFMKKAGKTVTGIVMITAVITFVAALDGQGVAALLIVGPPMVIVFDKLKIRRTLLALIFCLMIPAMNFFPWAGPTARAAAVIGMEPTALYMKMLPINAIAVVLTFVILIFASKAEAKRGEFLSNVGYTLEREDISEEDKALRRPKLFWVNLAITVIVLVALFIGVPSYIAFLIGCGIVLPLNYRTIKEQEKRIKSYAGPILTAVYTLIGAGALLGIMEGLGMFEAVGKALASIIPGWMSSFVEYVVGIFITPLGYFLDANAMMYGIMPVVSNMGAQYGVSSATVATMFVSGHNLSSALCITNPTVYFAMGILGVSYRDAFKANFLWTLLLGTVLVFLSAIIVI
jgi:CitMHS family citrate-Mg2+:H+ or citrate-Ca2+:H+ symporter